MIDQNHIYWIFPSDQRNQQISSRYDFDQLFPVGLNDDTDKMFNIDLLSNHCVKQFQHQPYWHAS
jgi:hypothetical protein